MAHFAEFDANNRVLRVVVADQEDIDANGGEQAEADAKTIESMVPWVGLGVKWMETYRTKAWRKK